MKPLLAACAWLLLLACRAEDKAIAELYIGGFFGDRITVNIRGDQCLYRISSGDDSDLTWKATTIAASDLAEFVKTCDAIGVFGWHERYDDKRVADGTQWSIRIRVGDRKISSGGSNDFPTRFDEFKAAVAKLVGRTFE